MVFDLARIDDIPALVDLLALLFAQEAEFTPEREAQVRGLTKIISDESTGFILVARDGGRIVGMVNILFTVSTALGERVGLLEDMVVSFEGRGSGTGSMLLAKALETAGDKGCRRMTLLTDADNDGAHRFYERSGFTKSSMVAFRKMLSDSKSRAL